MTGRGLRTAPGRVGFALALGESGRGPRTATTLAGITFDLTGRVDSAHVPLLVWEVAVTASGHAIPLAALVTARGQKREDDEPDVRNRRLWRRWLSLKLLLSLKHLRSSSSCWGNYCCSASVCCAGSRQVFLKPGRILFPWSGWRCCGHGCSCIWSGGSAVPFGSGWRGSHFLCCDCGSCWSGRSSSCFRCSARLVRPSAASGGRPL